MKIETVMSEYERAAETDVSKSRETPHKIPKQKLTPHTDYNWVHIVLPYYLCTASRLHASISNFLKHFGSIGTKGTTVTKERVLLGMQG
jgi:hypothetical protein